MKSVCVALFVICALQIVHSDDTIGAQRFDTVSNYKHPLQRERESFIEFFENIAQQTIQLAKDAIKVLQSRIEQLFQDIYEKLLGVQQAGDDALNEILSDVEKLGENQLRGGVTSCIQNHMDEIKQVIASGRDDMSKCILDAMNEADSISESLYPYVESIATLIKNVTGVIDKCSSSSNPIAVAICITQHVTEVSNAISAIIRESQEAIRLAIVEVNTLVMNTRACVKTTTDAVKAAVQNIIKECNSQPPTKNLLI